MPSPAARSPTSTSRDAPSCPPSSPKSLPYAPPWWLRNGLAMTLHTAWWMKSRWLDRTNEAATYREVAVTGADGIRLAGWLSECDATTRGTIVATYGITGRLENQWYLQCFARHARDRGYAVLLLDWRTHGKSVEFSPSLTSDGIYEGRDFLAAAQWLKDRGYPSPFFFSGYSLGGQLALWAAKYGSELASGPIASTDRDDRPGTLTRDDLGGVAALVPSLQSNRSLCYLESHAIGRYIDRRIATNIREFVRSIHARHPDRIDLSKLDDILTIRDYDREYAIGPLGFETVEDYFAASSPLPFLPHLTLPTQIIYAVNDPMFDPTLVDDLRAACAGNPAIALHLTARGGHVAHRASASCQRRYGDPDPWWAMHRTLDWIDDRVADWRTARLNRPPCEVIAQ